MLKQMASVHIYTNPSWVSRLAFAADKKRLGILRDVMHCFQRVHGDFESIFFFVLYGNSLHGTLVECFGTLLA